MPCTFCSGVLQHFCTALHSSDAGEGCKDLTQPSSAWGSLCWPRCKITLYPQTGCCHGRNTGRESAYSSWSCLLISGNTFPLSESIYETAKWSRPHPMSLLDKMPGACGPHCLGALLQFQLSSLSASFHASILCATCFLKDPTNTWPCLAGKHLLQQIQRRTLPLGLCSHSVLNPTGQTRWLLAQAGLSARSVPPSPFAEQTGGTSRFMQLD